MNTLKAEVVATVPEFPAAELLSSARPLETHAVSAKAVYMGDNEIMVLIAQGDPGAFQALMQRHMRSMVALARRITLNNSDADEIVQEAFLRVWIHARKWDVHGTAQPRTWLQRVVTNLAIDRKRKPQNLPIEAAGDPADLRYDTEKDLASSEEGVLVRQALETLPARQRVAIALSYFENLSDTEAAACLDVSVGALESLLVRARKQLRTTLQMIHDEGRRP